MTSDCTRSHFFKGQSMVEYLVVLDQLLLEPPLRLDQRQQPRNLGEDRLGVCAFGREQLAV